VSVNVDTRAPVLSATPRSALVDEPFAITVEKLSPGARVAISSRLVDDAGQTWSASATFRADATGRVDVRRDAPEAGGSYRGVEPMGLVWSLRPQKEGSGNPMLFRRRLDPMRMVIEVATDEGSASATLERLSVAPTVTRTEVRDRGLVGTLFEPAGTPAPALVVLGGSGGGLTEPLAALFASHGFAALALGYFAAPGLPEELKNIPLEYFETAFDWLRDRPSVRAERVGVVGSSRGGELALLLGATFPRVGAVVSYAPSALVYGGLGRTGTGVTPAWLYRGEAVPWFQPSRPPAPPAAAQSGPIPLTPGFLAGLEDRPAVERALIPVERVNGPILLVSGDDDQMWPSSRYASMVMSRLRERGHAFADQHLAYPGCGHLVNFPYVPTTVDASKHPITGHVFAYGGTPEGQAHAREDSWPRVLAFLRDALA
jgi:dienelactone hydrolase